MSAAANLPLERLRRTFNLSINEARVLVLLTALELDTRLRETVRQISCSQCGAPVDLARDPACSHCGAPIALIDPEGVAKALQDLATAGNKAAPDEREAMRTALSDAQVNAIFELERMRGSEPKPEYDLLAVGLSAVGAFLAERLGSL